MGPLWYEAVTTAASTFQTYVENILSSSLARTLPNGVTIMPSDKVKLALLLVEKITSDVWFCPEDDDVATLNLIENQVDGNPKKDDCKHMFAARILADMPKEKEVELDLKEKDQVFIVERKPTFVAVVYPKKNRCDSKGAQARPGVIQKTQKMSKARCRTCKGRDGCYHLVIFNLAKEEDTTVKNLESDRLSEKETSKRKTNVETDLIEDDANLDANVAKKAKSKKLNSLNPENFTGPAANVFGQRFDYPPSKDDKVSNNKINKEETLFPNKKMIPPGLDSEKCKCGNTFDRVALENRHPIIHHSKRFKKW